MDILICAFTKSIDWWSSSSLSGLFTIYCWLLKLKAKASDSYIAHFTLTKPEQPRFTIIGSGSWLVRANGAAALMRPSTERINEQLDPRQQLANTPLPQSTTPGLHLASIHHMAPYGIWLQLTTHLSTPKGWKADWPSWLACSGRFTHITGHSSDAGRAQDTGRQGRYEDQRLMFYHCATLPTSLPRWPGAI